LVIETNRDGSGLSSANKEDHWDDCRRPQDRSVCHDRHPVWLRGITYSGVGPRMVYARHIASKIVMILEGYSRAAMATRKMLAESSCLARSPLFSSLAMGFLTWHSVVVS